MNQSLPESEIKALVSLLADNDDEVYSLVTKQILEFGDGIIPYLEEEWERNFMPEVQKRIEDLIHVLQFDNLRRKLTEWKNNGGKDLLEGMWLVNLYMYPDLDIIKLKSKIEQIYYETWLEFKPDIHPFDQLRIINHVIFNKLRFGANNKNFHAPGNSMINVVLETRRGNPISLCVIYMLVAQKMKLPVYGVNLPNMFILTYKSEHNQFYINVFNKGVLLTKSDIDNYISSLKLEPSDVFYEPCSHIDIVRRVLRNLMVKILLNDISDNENANY
jgi:regulator of sirC expression with transglutaminase-like and TPR domain